MSLTVEIEPDSHATYAVEPEYGRRVVFEVRRREVTLGQTSSWYRKERRDYRWVVGLIGSDGKGFSQHVAFDTACARALTRARRYEKAYSKPRGVPAVLRGAA